MDIENSDLLKETINFVENIEFSDKIQPKTEIKEEEGLDQDVWKYSTFDVKPKLEQIEASETGEAKIKTEPEEFFSNDETETLCNESIDIKDEFMWTMKDFVSDNGPLDNVPPRNIEQQIAAVHEKKKAFECSLCPYKVDRKGVLNKHIAAVHEKKKPFVCSMCPTKFTEKGSLDKHIGAVHEKKKPFECSMCSFKFARKFALTTHIGAVHEKKK